MAHISVSRVKKKKTRRYNHEISAFDFLHQDSYVLYIFSDMLKMPIRSFLNKYALIGMHFRTEI